MPPRGNQPQERVCAANWRRSLCAAKRWARNRRLEYLELNVLAQNENAIRLYESQDFVEATKVMRCML